MIIGGSINQNCSKFLKTSPQAMEKKRQELSEMGSKDCLTDERFQMLSALTVVTYGALLLQHSINALQDQGKLFLLSF